MLDCALANLGTCLRSTEDGLIDIAGALGGLPIPHDVEFHVNAAERVVNRVIAEIVELAIVDVRGQRLRELGVASYLGKLRLGECQRPAASVKDGHLLPVVERLVRE